MHSIWKSFALFWATSSKNKFVAFYKVNQLRTTWISIDNYKTTKWETDRLNCILFLDWILTRDSGAITNKNCLSDYISKWTFVVAHASVCRRIFRHLVSINFITVAICWLKHVLHTSCFDTLYKTLQTLIWDGIKDIIVHKAQTYCKQINPKVNLRFSFLSFKG